MEKKDFQPEESAPKKKPAKQVVDDEPVYDPADDVVENPTNVEPPPGVSPDGYVAPSAYADKVDKSTIVDAPPTE
jgi:hypothetical protein